MHTSTHIKTISSSDQAIRKTGASHGSLQVIKKVNLRPLNL